MSEQPEIQPSPEISSPPPKTGGNGQPNPGQPPTGPAPPGPMPSIASQPVAIVVGMISNLKAKTKVIIGSLGALWTAYSTFGPFHDWVHTNVLQAHPKMTKWFSLGAIVYAFLHQPKKTEPPMP